MTVLVGRILVLVFVITMMNREVDCSEAWPPSYLSLLTIIISVIFCLVITTGNFMILILVIINPLKKLRSPFNYFVVNLAVADLIVGMISMPVTIYFHVLEYLKKKSDAVLLIRFSHMTLFISLTASLLCLMFLSIDRYIAITFPMKYRSNLSWKKYWIASFIILLISVAFSSIYFTTGYIDFLVIYINTAVIIVGITLIMTCTRVYRFLRAQSQRIKKITKTESGHGKASEASRKSHQYRVTRVFLWIVFLFLVCYIPATIVVYVLKFHSTRNCEFIHIMRDISFYLVSVNSCINPFVHAFKNKHYKDAFLELWKRLRRETSVSASSLSSQRNTISTIDSYIDEKNR